MLRSKAIVLERDSLLKIDPLTGAWYWPAMQAYWNRRYGLSRVELSALDEMDYLEDL